MAGFSVIGSARDGEEALSKIRSLRPDLIVMDVKMPRLSGIEIAKSLENESGVDVLFYSAYGDRAILSEAMDAGGKGFLLKESPLADLIRALKMISEGKPYIDPILAGAIASSEEEAPVKNLTKREREVLRHLADGLTNEQIGKVLFISPETVRTHLRKAMAKLGAENRVKAVALALRSEIIK